MAGYAYLDLDVNALMLDLSTYMATVCDKLAEDMVEEMYGAKVWASNNSEKGFKESTLRSKDAYSKEDAVASLAYVSVTLIQNVYGILSSYGTGENRDEYNPFWNDYVKSPLYNKLRNGGDTIVGRAEGSYYNIFDQSEYSFGTKAGQPTGFKGMVPSYGIQNTERNYLGDENVDGALSENGIFFQKLSASVEDWIEQNAFNYFIEVGV